MKKNIIKWTINVFLASGIAVSDYYLILWGSKYIEKTLGTGICFVYVGIVVFISIILMQLLSSFIFFMLFNEIE